MSSPTTAYPAFPTAPTATFPTAESTSQTSNNSSSGPKTNLYLFTFLATIMVLLAVSLAIASRSYLIRRRYRQRVEEAILRGETLDGMDTYLGLNGARLGPRAMAAATRTHRGAAGKKHQPLGRRPDMYEVLMGPGPRREAEKTQGLAALEPIALQLFLPPSFQQSAQSFAQTTHNPNARLLMALPPPPTFLPSFRRRQPFTPAPPPPPASVSPANQLPPLPEIEHGAELALSVLVKMPMQEGALPERDDGEVEVPECEFGWMRVSVD